jgi:hypothetical protein
VGSEFDQGTRHFEHKKDKGTPVPQGALTRSQSQIAERQFRAQLGELMLPSSTADLAGWVLPTDLPPEVGWCVPAALNQSTRLRSSPWSLSSCLPLFRFLFSVLASHYLLCFFLLSLVLLFFASFFGGVAYDLLLFFSCSCAAQVGLFSRAAGSLYSAFGIAHVSIQEIRV